MISDAILIHTVDLKQVESITYDDIGCKTGVTYSTPITVPAYVTETQYKETIDGKQVNINGYLCYVNYITALDAIDKTWVVTYNNNDYPIVNIDRTFDNMHIEILITDVSND
jgi:hypothetical protein